MDVQYSFVIPVDKQPPKPETLLLKGDFKEFTHVMERLMRVPYSEVNARLDLERQARKRKRAKTSGRVSRAKG